MINCPQCHRALPEDKLAEHLRQHKVAPPTHLKNLPSSKPVTRPKPQLSQTKLQKSFEKHLQKSVAIQRKARQYTVQLGIKRSNLSQEQVQSKFENALKEVDTPYQSLKLQTFKEPRAYKTSIDEQRNIMLQYNPDMLRILSEETIDATLLSLACMASAIPHNIHTVPDTDGFEYKYWVECCLESYDTYLAFIEFVNRFGQDRRCNTLRQLEIRFTNLESIMDIYREKTKYYQKMRQVLNQYEVFAQIVNVTGDAFLFYMTKDDSFARWCKKQNLDALHVLIHWMYEDFEHIRSLKLPYRESQNKVLASCKLSLQVDPYKLLNTGKIEFYEETEALHREMIKEGKDTDLVELWEKRRSQYQK